MENNVKYIHQLSKRMTSKNLDWIEKNTLKHDIVTGIIFTKGMNLPEKNYKLNSVYFTAKNFGFNLDEEYLEEFNAEDNIETFLDSLQGKVEDKVLNEIKTFTNKKEVNCQNKSTASVLWANIIHNTINKTNTSLNKDLVSLFYYVCANADDNDEIKLTQIIDETFEIFNDKNEISNYFNTINSTIADRKSWFDFSVYPLKQISNDMKNDLIINNNDEMMTALHDFANLPSVIKYIKESYLQDTNTKSEGYCPNDLVRDYKAFTIALKLTDDIQFKNDKNFDKNNNIGLNINAKLYALERIIKNNNLNYINSELFSGFKSQSRKIANSILGIDNYNVYGVWKPIIKNYIKRCKLLAGKVKIKNLTVTDRKYLKSLGLVKDREVIKDYNRILIGLKNKVDDASKLLNYLNKKDIEELKEDPFIEDAQNLYIEFKNWAQNLKISSPMYVKASVREAQNLPQSLSTIHSISARKPVGNNYIVKNQKDTLDVTQLSLDDLENQ